MLLSAIAALGCGCGDDAASSQAPPQKHDGGRVIAKDASASSDEDAGSSHGHSEADGSIAKLSFFVTSDRSMTGNLGGLTGADARCKKLATEIGAGDKTWHAYLSVEHDPNNDDKATDARTRIGSGPWFNAKGVMLAADLDALHARTGDAEVFIDEHGEKIPGQWPGSPPPVEHDVLTGSNGDGTLLAGQTCKDWTSTNMNDTAQVGHTDGLGPGASPNPPYSSWNSAHANGGCNDTAPRGGAGRLYCFAVD